MASPQPPSLITPARLKALPDKPGVYIMRGESGEILYIGKAKHLRNRVRSYFSGSDDRRSVPFLLEQAITIETLVTEDERQAIILEADLIRKHKPHYNIRLKDDRAHIVVRIDESADWPRIELVRKVKEDGARYIGPFTFSYELRTLLEVMQRVIPLRTCSDRVLHNRVRPCLEHQIKRCCAPCCLPVDRLYYSGLLEQATSILQGNVEAVVASLEFDMAHASEELRFEDAAECRDRIQILRKIQQERSENKYGVESYDVFGIYREGGNAELSILQVRDGRLFDSKTFGFSNVQILDRDLLSSALIQFYRGDTFTPQTVLLPVQLEEVKALEEVLSERGEKKVYIEFPQRGPKRSLLELATTNAKENFEARFSQLDKQERVMMALRDQFDLIDAPRLVECVDVSHFQGGQTVGVVTCFRDLKPDKSRYRSFHLSQDQPDDFASMHELVRRHLSRQAEENTVADLLVIDGGKAQLEMALRARAELGLEQPQIVSLAKKRLETAQYRSVRSGKRKPERVYLEGVEVPVVLDPRSEVLQFLERLRDETHRSAVQFHRKTRSRRNFKSVLDDIPGIGPQRKELLLREFGSLERLKKASVEELIGRAKLPKPLAERVIRLLHSTES